MKHSKGACLIVCQFLPLRSFRHYNPQMSLPRSPQTLGWLLFETANAPFPSKMKARQPAPEHSKTIGELSPVTPHPGIVQQHRSDSP